MVEKYSEEQLVKLAFRDTTLDLEDRVQDLLSRLSLDEKIKLLHNRRFHFYYANGVKRLGIEFFGTTDGPLGVACHSSLKKNTRFPTTIALAATWNPALSEQMGIAIGKETRATGNHIILAPGINIDRTPLGGRTFEYFSEDPRLTSLMAAPFVKGVQSQRIAACLKHFVANNQETKRMSISVEIDERTLHEIYLRAFIDIVKETDPWSVMTCYNMINGTYGSENKYVLREILMDKYGFSGFAVTDWFASRNQEIDTARCLNAGLSLEMPMTLKYKPKHVKKALAEGKVTEETLDDNVRRILRTYIRVGLVDDHKTRPEGARNTRDHQELARKIAEESMVLLKNEGGLLPLKALELEKILVMGPNATKKFGKFLSGGSSAVVPPYEVTPLQGLAARCKEHGIKIEASRKNISKADTVILLMGLKLARGMDSEMGDKNTLELPGEQVTLIKETVKLNPKTIVVLFNGSPVAMDGWLEDVPAVLEAWYPGMEGGNALASALFGDVNPSGKLPVTFPRTLADSPAHRSDRTFPGVPAEKPAKVYYEEGIYVGYRHFDEEQIEPLFPFGFGLSYTTFEYGSLHVDKKKLGKDDEKFTVSVDVTNTGNCRGAEVVQVYAHDIESSVDRPPKELIGFGKVMVEPGETKTVNIEIKVDTLAYYDISIHDFKVEAGNFKIQVGTSSRDIRQATLINYI
jgi:beta-glucosidase